MSTFLSHILQQNLFVLMIISDGLWLSEQVGPNKMYPPNHAYNLENTGKSACPYLNMHVLRYYFSKLHSN